jgi:hypothetical protein
LARVEAKVLVSVLLIAGRRNSPNLKEMTRVISQWTLESTRDSAKFLVKRTSNGKTAVTFGEEGMRDSTYCTPYFIETFKEYSNTIPRTLDGLHRHHPWKDAVRANEKTRNGEHPLLGRIYRTHVDIVISR